MTGTLDAQSLNIAGVDLSLGSPRAPFLRALAATDVQVMANRDSTHFIVLGAHRHSALLQFTRDGALVHITKTFSEFQVPVAERIALRLDAWRTFESIRGTTPCVTRMVDETPTPSSRANAINIECGLHSFKYLSIVANESEEHRYSISLNRDPR